MRTAVAVVTLLISVLLLHLAAPHDTTVPATVSQQTAAPLGISGAEPLAPGFPHRGPVGHYYYDNVGSRLARVAFSPSIDFPPPTAVAVACGSSAVLTGAVHACTARDGTTPSAAESPTRVMLQSFRC